MIDEILEMMGFRPDAASLYRHVLENGATTGGELARVTGMARATVYDALDKLTDQGLVKQSLYRGIKRYVAEPPSVLSQALTQQIDHLEQTRAGFEKILPMLEKRHAEHFVAPKFQLFEGPDAIRNLLNDMLLFRDLETRSFWPIKTTVETLSPAFFKDHNRRRIDNNLSVKAIWPQDRMIDTKKYPYLGSGKDHLRQIRIAPLEMDFAMGYWIYGTRIAFLSSKNEAVGFIIDSREMAHMMSVQHELIWKLSKPIEKFTASK